MEVNADFSELPPPLPCFVQLWKSVGLTPKLMGDRREQFLVEQGIGVVPPPSEALRREGLDDVPPPVTVVCGSSRSARAVQRACRQRFSAYTDSDKRRSPKDMKVRPPSMPALKEQALCAWKLSIPCVSLACILEDLRLSLLSRHASCVMLPALFVWDSVLLLGFVCCAHSCDLAFVCRFGASLGCSHRGVREPD